MLPLFSPLYLWEVQHSSSAQSAVVSKIRNSTWSIPMVAFDEAKTQLLSLRYSKQSLTPLASAASYKAALVLRLGVEAQKRISQSEMKISRRWQSINISMCRIRIQLFTPPPSAASSRHLLAPPHRDGRTRTKLAASMLLYNRAKVKKPSSW